MPKSKAPVDHEWIQAVAVVRECATNPNQSFTRDELGSRIGVDPYNMERRGARYVRMVSGYVERVKVTGYVEHRRWDGHVVGTQRLVFVWRLVARRRAQQRALIVAEFKKEHGL